MPNSRGWSVGVWPQRRPPPPRQCVWCMHFCCHTHTPGWPPFAPRTIHPRRPNWYFMFGDLFFAPLPKTQRAKEFIWFNGFEGECGCSFFFFYFIFCVCMSNSLQLQSRMSGTYSNSLGRDTMDLWRGVRSHQVR